MLSHARSLAILAAATSVLAACGSSSGGTSSAQSRLSQITAATQATATSSAPTGPTINLAAVDACALLSRTDAESVAHAEQLDEFQTASTVYTFTATKQADSTGSSCTFRIKAPAGEDGEGSVVFHVRPAGKFTVPPDGQPLTGLGTEAYDTGTSPVVRVGNVKIFSDDNSFSDSVTVALLRKMVPKLR